MSEDMLGPMCLIKERKILCCLKDACLPALTKPPLMSPPPLLALEAEHCNTKGALYISKPAVISWKRLTVCQVWEKDKGITAALS